MGLFNRKTDEQLDHELVVQDATRTLLAKPRAPRKPKEAIKPWGKKERLFVLYVLLFTTIASAFFGLSAREWKLPGLPKLEFEIPNFSKGTIILENEDKTKINND